MHSHNAQLLASHPIHLIGVCARQSRQPLRHLQMTTQARKRKCSIPVLTQTQRYRKIVSFQRGNINYAIVTVDCAQYVSKCKPCDHSNIQNAEAKRHALLAMLSHIPYIKIHEHNITCNGKQSTHTDLQYMHSHKAQLLASHPIPLIGVCARQGRQPLRHLQMTIQARQSKCRITVLTHRCKDIAK